jgi:hypothetical protein
MFHSTRGHLAIKLTIGVLTLVSAAATSVVSAAASTGFYSCEPGYVYVAHSPIYSFIATPRYTYTVYNGGGTWNTESFTVGTTESYTVGLTASVSGGFNVGANIEIFVIGAQQTVSAGLSASVTKSTGTTLTSNLSTPPKYYAHFESGAWAYQTSGEVDWVTQNCVQSKVSTVYSATVPIKNDSGIKPWYNTTP